MKTRFTILLPALALLAIVWGAGLYAREPAARFQGDSLPTPPRQSAPWTPPKTRLSSRLIAATRTLFAQGLADPRGCEYREVEVAADRHQQGVPSVEWHGWVLPPDPTRPGRFAIRSDGLVYPIVEVGRAADLRADVEAREKNRIGSLGVCLLLRLGEGSLAEKFYGLARPRDTEPAYYPQVNTDHREFYDPYAPLANEWLEALYDRAMFAHTTGDDALALVSARTLVAAIPAAETEALDLDIPCGSPDPNRNRPSDSVAKYFEGYELIRPILSDQERRADERRKKTGPPVHFDDFECPNDVAAFWKEVERRLGRRLAPPHRVALVIQWFEESGPMYETWFGRLLHDYRDEAVEPLLDCMLHDTRLTRSGDYAGDYGIKPNTVGDIAYKVLCAILETGFDEPGENSGDENSSPKGRQALAERIRAYWHKLRGVSASDAWYKVLCDDAESPERWAEAVRKTIMPPAIPYTSEIAEIAARRKALREKRNPSVTDMLIKRATSLTKQGTLPEATAIALALADWEPPAALPILRRQHALWLEKLRDADLGRIHTIPWQLIQITLARTKLKDRSALADYIQVLREVSFKDGGINTNVFGPLLEHPDDPAVAAGADWMFNDPASPWHAILGENGPIEGREPAFFLGRNRLLELAAFRKLVLHTLQDTRAVSTGNSISRRCDICAHGLSEIDGMPLCDFAWPTAQRDRAVADSARMLERYGHLLAPATGRRAIGQMQITLPALDHPATLEDVRGNRAIFSLEGQGQVRLCKLHARPAEARWITNRDNPYVAHDYDEVHKKDVPRTAYHQEGIVWQAEEILINGKWQRYYGFAGIGHLGKVPAEEIEFDVDGAPWDESFNFLRLYQGQVALVNRAGLPRLPPRFRTADDAGPVAANAGPKAATVDFRLYRYSGRSKPPQDYSYDFAEPRPGEDPKWREVPRKAGVRMKLVDLPPEIQPMEAFLVLKADLDRDYPQLSPGTYRELATVNRGGGKPPLKLADYPFTVKAPTPPPENRRPQGDGLFDH